MADPDTIKPCAYCHGLGEMRSTIDHGPGWTICIDRKTESCPRCLGSGCDPDPAERIRIEAADVSDAK
jgi:hypothetical protein